MKHNIVPHLHPEYKRYFVDKPAELALTYQWTSTFRELRAGPEPGARWRGTASCS